MNRIIYLINKIMKIKCQLFRKYKLKYNYIIHIKLLKISYIMN
jgi:hypothetical protein